MSDREAEENLTAKLVETGYREELKKKVREDHQMITKLSQTGCQINSFPLTLDIYLIFFVCLSKKYTPS